MAESITITDNRTGESIEIPIVNGGVVGRRVVASSSPASGSTTPASCRRRRARARSPTSTATPGILRYRGYPIEQLAEHSTYLEVAYLLLHGELPDRRTSSTTGSTRSPCTPSSTRTCASGSSRASTTTPTPWACWSRRWPPCRPSTSTPRRSSTRRPATSRSSGSSPRCPPWPPPPTASAWACRSSTPTTRSTSPSNFLSMMWKVAEPRFEADPVLARALDVLFILHADHEQNCSTTAMRVVGSSHADPYSATAAAAAALYGPRHGGANEAVIQMLTEIGIDRERARLHRGGEGGQRAGSRASATASTRATTPGPRSSSGPPTRCSR